jgi:hypothetical protein
MARVHTSTADDYHYIPTKEAPLPPAMPPSLQPSRAATRHGLGPEPEVDVVPHQALAPAAGMPAGRFQAQVTT